MKCSICSEDKVKKTIVVDNVKIYIDPITNKQWNDKNECPECVDLGSLLDDPIPKKTTRKCRGCSKFLDSTRYFNCIECQPELPLVDEEFMFEDGGDLDIDEDFFESLSPRTNSEFNWLINSDQINQKKKEDIILGKEKWKQSK